MAASGQLGKLRKSNQTDDADTSRLELTLRDAEIWQRLIIPRREDTEFLGRRKLEFRTQPLASLLSGTKVDVCRCPKMEKQVGDHSIFISRGATTSEGCETNDATKTVVLFWGWTARLHTTGTLTE